MNKKGLSKVWKIILIFLTIVIGGPLIFVGSCLPLGFVGFGMGFENSSVIESKIGEVIFYSGWVIGIVLAVLVVWFIIKKINSIKTE